MDETTTAHCARCQKDKDVSQFHTDRRRRPNRVCAQCKECRLALAQAKTYQVACLDCARHRRLGPNGLCMRCNRARGLRFCRRCRTMLPALLSFYEGRAVCKDCLKLRRAEGCANLPLGPEQDSTG